jgi:hypothetical protein
MRFALRFLLAIALLPALAAAGPATDARIDELLHMSGLWNQLAQIEAQVKAGAAQSQAEAKGGGPGALTDAQYKRLQAAIGVAFAADRLRSAARKEFTDALGAGEVDDVLGWLSTDLGKRATRLEEESGEMEAAKRMEREAPALLAALPASRVERFEKFVRLTRAGESMASSLINVMTAVVYGMALATPPSDTSLADTVRERLESQRPQLVAKYTKEAVLQFAYTYRTFSDEEIDRYIAFAETPSGRKYHDASFKLLDEVFARGSLEMGREIGRATDIQPRRSS